MAFEKKEYKECVNCFLDILDYEETLLNKNTYLFAIYSNENLVKDHIFVKLFQVRNAFITTNRLPLICLISTVLELFLHY